jgi:hypothetical protein
MNNKARKVMKNVKNNSYGKILYSSESKLPPFSLFCLLNVLQFKRCILKRADISSQSKGVGDCVH